MKDVYGRVWPDGYDLCPTCGQPDDCEDCNHNRLSGEDVKQILRGEE